MTARVRWLKTKYGEVPLDLRADGNYYDTFGTQYPGWMFDKNFCGIWKIETGKHDPLWREGCSEHDRLMVLLKLGLSSPSVSDETIALGFIKSMGQSFLQGLYRVVAAPFYGVVGGLGGYLLAKVRKL